jgi:hypothetical protein
VAGPCDSCDQPDEPNDGDGTDGNGSSLQYCSSITLRCFWGIHRPNGNRVEDGEEPALRKAGPEAPIANPELVGMDLPALIAYLFVPPHCSLRFLLDSAPVLHARRGIDNNILSTIETPDNNAI